jgi:hypothetical protein
MNKWTNEQMHLGHCCIDHSLNIEHSSHLSIASVGGV